MRPRIHPVLKHDSVYRKAYFSLARYKQQMKKIGKAARAIIDKEFNPKSK